MKLAICGPTTWLINDAPFFDRWDQGLGSELKIRETDVLESKWEELGPYDITGYENCKRLCATQPIPLIFSWSNLGPELAHRWLKIKLLFNNRDCILTILEVLLKLTQFWKIIFILALNLNHLIISVQNNETWRWDHPFLCWSSAILRRPVK